MAIVQTPDSRVYMQVAATKPATLPAIATIAVTANRVDDKGLDRFLVAEVRQRRIRLGNDAANSAKVYRDALKGQDFTSSWRSEYRDEATALARTLWNHGLCANYYVSFVFRPEGDGAGKPQLYGHCMIAQPTPADDSRGRIFTFTAEGDGGVDVSDQ